MNLLFISLFALLGLTRAQSRCVNGFSCINERQFETCGPDALEEGESGPMRCATIKGEQTVCFGGDVGYGSANDESGPCLKRPQCSETGTFGIAQGKVRIPELCSAYYDCAQAEPGRWRVVPGVCNSGLEFSPTTRKCEPVAVANCSRPLAAASTPTPNAVPSSNPAPSSIPSSVSTTTIPTTRPTTRTPTTAVPTEDYGEYSEYPDPEPPKSTPRPAVCVRNGRMADPESCRHFYLCNALGMRKIRCPLNLLYNERMRMCWFRVNCGTRKV